jgi:hypothetical protein
MMTADDLDAKAICKQAIVGDGLGVVLLEGSDVEVFVYISKEDVSRGASMNLITGKQLRTYRHARRPFLIEYVRPRQS